MEIRAKNKYKATIKSNHKKYLEKILFVDTPNFTKRFERLKRNCNNLLRRKEGSIKSIKESSRIVKIIFGISEDIMRLSLPQYDFEIEKEIINLYIIEGLKIRRNTKYFGECRFYGEVLLNLYLDVLIVLTSNDIARIIEHKPMYLVNPETGKNLELDITLEGVKLSFELQGDTHYLNENEFKKDKFKIIKSIEKNKVLIPLNLGQLQSNKIGNIIANTLKEVLGLHDVITGRGEKKQSLFETKKHDILIYAKVIQRMYLANLWLNPCLEWINVYAQDL